MLDDIAGTYGSRLFVAAGGVAVALLVLVGVLWLVRNRAPSPFVRGGKGRQQRLQVLDAAAIDARRRIVLIRRDGVEHLIMIGGPTDIVIETGIGDTAKSGQTAIAAPVPLEAITAREAPPPAQSLQAPREQQRVAHSQPEPVAQLSPRPVQAAIEAPVAASERRAQPEPKPPSIPAIVPEAAFVAPPVEQARPAVPPVRTEPPVQPAAPERIEPVVFERKEELAAADVLEAARTRVLAPQTERVSDVIVTPPPPPATSSPAPILAKDAYSESFDGPAPEVPPPTKLGSDFESVLEAEMSKTLSAERPGQMPPQSRTPSAPEPTVQQPRRDPEMAPVVGGDAALQKEVARIFGEMSVDRDK
ncbi:MAG: flagellar biosynthesis protein FliO [Rhizobium sp.]